jgi:hypothetical protein
MLTVTIRHGRTDELADTKRVTEAWKRTITGKAWQDFKAEYGIAGNVRALEVTHGNNGWHPHLHVLFFLEAALSDSELLAARDWLSARWQRNVERCLGADFVPSDERGVNLIRCAGGEYVSKMNLELVSHQTKKGRFGSRSHWQIAADLAAKGSPSDAALWRDLQANLYRKRCLTWSLGLRSKLGFGVEQTDAEVLAAEDREDHVVEIQGVIWDSIARIDGVLASLLEAAESGRRELVEAVIAQATGRASVLCAVSLPHAEHPKMTPLPAKYSRISEVRSVDSPCRIKRRPESVRASFSALDASGARDELKASILEKAADFGLPPDAVACSMALGRLASAGQLEAFGGALRARTRRKSGQPVFDLPAQEQRGFVAPNDWTAYEARQVRISHAVATATGER